MHSCIVSVLFLISVIHPLCSAGDHVLDLLLEGPRKISRFGNSIFLSLMCECTDVDTVQVQTEIIVQCNSYSDMQSLIGPQGGLIHWTLHAV